MTFCKFFQILKSEIAIKSTSEDTSNVLKLDYECIPISHFGEINKVWKVPQLLIDIESKLGFSNKNWDEDIAAMLKAPFPKQKMIGVLKKKAINFTQQEAIMAFLWFFRGVSACDGRHPFIKRLRDAHSLRSDGN